MSDPSCRMFRESLGVYVVGAIEPAERAAVEDHLSQCYECREELAGLAMLPALMHRVPLEDAERLANANPGAPDIAGPSADMLDSLLKRVGARRRTKRVRAAFTTAAAILIAVGGAAAVTESVAQQPTASHAFDAASASAHGVTVTVHYTKTNWGTGMSVRASGLPMWTHCKFWVVTKSGQRVLAGGWLINYAGSQTWYPAQSRVPEGSVTGFVLTAGKNLQIRIPAP
jgi:anti-sigma factor RsiW